MSARPVRPTEAAWRHFHDTTKFFARDDDGLSWDVEFNHTHIGVVTRRSDEWEWEALKGGVVVGSEYTRIDAASLLTDWSNA